MADVLRVTNAYSHIQLKKASAQPQSVATASDVVILPPVDVASSTEGLGYSNQKFRITFRIQGRGVNIWKIAFKYHTVLSLTMIRIFPTSGRQTIHQ